MKLPSRYCELFESKKFEETPVPLAEAGEEFSVDLDNCQVKKIMLWRISSVFIFFKVMKV